MRKSELLLPSQIAKTKSNSIDLMVMSIQVYPFHSFCSVNTHCDVVVRFAGVNVIKRFRYIIVVVSVADCFHLSGVE